MRNLFVSLHITVACLIAAIAVAQAQDHPKPVPVPDALRVPANAEPFLTAHAIGTQNYVCLPTAPASGSGSGSGSGFAFSLFTPQATLSSPGQHQQLATHFLAPNPAENGTGRPAWQDSRDGSTVWGKAAQQSSDAAFVKPGAIPWLLLEITGTAAGPGGGSTLTKTAFIQRVNTTGGVAPSTGCESQADVGHRAFVPYTADYVFFKTR